VVGRFATTLLSVPEMKVKMRELSDRQDEISDLFVKLVQQYK